MTTEASAYYDRAGRPISYRRYKFLHADRAYIQVALTYVVPDREPEYAISTVWTGTDVSYPAHPPAIFETAVFHVGSKDCYQERYTSEGQARIGHAFFTADIAYKLKQEGISTRLVHSEPWVTLIKAADK